MSEPSIDKGFYSRRSEVFCGPGDACFDWPYLLASLVPNAALPWQLNPQPTIQNAVEAIGKDLENKVPHDIRMREYVEIVERSWIVRGSCVAGIGAASISCVASSVFRLAKFFQSVHPSGARSLADFAKIVEALARKTNAKYGNFAYISPKILTGENRLLMMRGAPRAFSPRAYRGSDFANLLGRMASDHKPNALRIRLDFPPPACPPPTEGSRA